ncbi:MAG TPA: PA14 domain-containing protein [Candidatus Methylacidiphilales bacterium]
MPGPRTIETTPVSSSDGSEKPAWKTSAGSKSLVLRPGDGWSSPSHGPIYLSVTYLDKGYGRLAATCKGTDGKEIKPDKFLGVYLLDSGSWKSAYFRFPGSSLASPSVLVGRDRSDDPELAVASATLSDTPFDDSHFRYVIDEPWRRPYDGPIVPAPDNTTLKGKVMVGYQAWFRTPNDPTDRGWVHWGDMSKPNFSTDMWPDVSQYPPETLDKACDVKTLSGKPAYLFSSVWPEVAQVHFRWMRENNIDGAFLQRFGGDNWAVNKVPQWALAAVREGANREGRIWAIEYDLSGVTDDRLLPFLQKDWGWLVDEFGLLGEKDPNYARVDGKPVVFLWGPGVPGRALTPPAVAKALDFLKNDPKYGGNYVILGGPGGWRKLSSEWLDVYKKADGVLGWMSQDYAEDLAASRSYGIDYYPHVWPGFSWANLKHLPSNSTSAYTPRNGGKVYESRFSKAAAAGCDRLFVGMWDEYDESTAIIPMSDDPPPTAERPGTTVKFFPNPKLQESSPLLFFPQAQIDLDGNSPTKNVPGSNFLMRWEGLLIPPADGSYTFSVEAPEGDSTTLWIDDKKVLDGKTQSDQPVKGASVTLTEGKRVVFRLDSLHGTAHGTFRLSWEGPGIERQPVPPAAFLDAWGRFITNEGSAPDLYLKLTGEARDMVGGKRSPGNLSTSSN